MLAILFVGSAANLRVTVLRTKAGGTQEQAARKSFKPKKRKAICKAKSRRKAKSQVEKIQAKAIEAGADDWSASRLVLSDDDRIAINQRASSGILRTLTAQGFMLGAAVIIGWLVGGGDAAVSALIGGAAYFVPNALFALRLLLGLFGPVKSSPFTFFVGEAFKLGSAMLVLGLAAWLGRGWLVWPAMLFGLVCVLKGYVLLLMFRKLP